MTWEDDDEEFEVCRECGGRLSFECVSSDADGNRRGFGSVCLKCGALFV